VIFYTKKRDINSPECTSTANEWWYLFSGHHWQNFSIC